MIERGEYRHRLCRRPGGVVVCASVVELFGKPILPGISALPYSPPGVQQPQEGVSTGLARVPGELSVGAGGGMVFARPTPRRLSRTVRLPHDWTFSRTNGPFADATPPGVGPRNTAWTL